MKKRGQFFIIGAVILGILILGLATTFNITLKKDEISQEKFNAMCQNYEKEVFEISKYTINTQNKSNEPELIKNFTIKFLNYSRTVDPNFRLLYVYGNNKNVTIFNYINHTLNIDITNGTENYPIEQLQSCDVHDIYINDISLCINSIANDSIKWINITNGKINKKYSIADDECFYFIARTTKEGEEYFCE